MYLNQIITYMVWPVFILVSWLIIRAVVILYERKSGSQAEEGV